MYMSPLQEGHAATCYYITLSAGQALNICYNYYNYNNNNLQNYYYYNFGDVKYLQNTAFWLLLYLRRPGGETR